MLRYASGSIKPNFPFTIVPSPMRRLPVSFIRRLSGGASIDYTGENTCLLCCDARLEMSAAGGVRARLEHDQ